MHRPLRRLLTNARCLHVADITTVTSDDPLESEGELPLVKRAAIARVGATPRDSDGELPGDAEPPSDEMRLIDMMSDIYVETGQDGVVIEWNRRAEELLGRPRHEAIGRVFEDIALDESDADLFRVERELLVGEEDTSSPAHRGRPVRVSDLSLRHSEGRRVSAEGVTWVDRDDQGLVVRLIAQDVTDRRASEQALANAHLHDALTGLPSRAMFSYHLSCALARQAREGGSVAVVLLDLDRFQSINDGLGHNVGDEVLIEVADRLSRTVRARDIVARFGGDEFLILIEGPSACDIAASTAGSIASALAEPISAGAAEVYVSCSIGISESGETAMDAASLLSSADAAMFRSKRRGGARHEIFRESMRTSALERLHTEHSLHRALERAELRVFYQPILSVHSRRVIGAEALVRWQHPERGLVLPADFIRSAEETGLIVAIDAWVLEQACGQFREWRSARASLGLGGGLGMVEVNLSARQVSDPKILDRVRGTLADTGLDPSCLAIEITESALMEDPESALVTLRRLKNLGVRLAVDDFGTGFSSLSYLRRFPLDVLKVDKSFVDELVTSQEDSVIVGAVVNLAHTLGLEVVAEGVESSNQLSALESLGCDHYQGFLFSPALPALDFSRHVIGVPGA